MINIILIAHGQMAAGVKDAVQIVFGNQPGITAISYSPDVEPQSLKQEILKQRNKSNSVLYITDIFGGTPFNTAARIVNDNPQKQALITGLNLPLVIEAVSAQLKYSDPNQLADYLVNLGKSMIKKYNP